MPDMSGDLVRPFFQFRTVQVLMPRRSAACAWRSTLLLLRIHLGLLFLLSTACHATIDPFDLERFVASARAQVGVTTGYDPAYRVMVYPGGDVDSSTGVCTDVLVRALRDQGIDLQKTLHEDMRGNFKKYPQNWKLKRPDTNIDHRRVPNLMTYFTRQGYSRKFTQNANDYVAGDIVAWNLGGGTTHIGVVSGRRTPLGTPLIIHNIGRGTLEEDILLQYRIIGHYRLTERKSNK
jgi:uncharacterized protein